MLFFRVSSSHSSKAAQSSILYWVTHCHGNQTNGSSHSCSLPLFHGERNHSMSREVSQLLRPSKVSFPICSWARDLLEQHWACVPARDMHIHGSMASAGRQGLRSKSSSRETVMISSYKLLDNSNKHTTKTMTTKWGWPSQSHDEITWAMW